MRQLLFIPCKPFHRAKTRLSSVLTPAERESLARKLFIHTLEAVRGVRTEIEPIVVTCGQEVIDIARRFGVPAIREVERSAGGLNNALQDAIAKFERRDDLRFTYLPTDLPGLTTVDLEEAVAETEWALIAPDRAVRGTNFMAWASRHPLTLAFGENSFQAHCESLSSARVRIVTARALREDVDLPCDLALLSGRESVLWPDRGYEQAGCSSRS